MSDLRTYLTDTAQRELDTLRASLDARLLALEAALAHPEPHDSLEDLVMDLARVASLEVETSAAHRWLQAQLKVQEQAAQKAEREAVAILRTELDQIRAALEAARERGNTLQHDVEIAHVTIQEERFGSARLEAELGKERDARADLSEAADTLRRELDAAQRDLATAHAEIESLRRNLDAAKQAAQSDAVDRDANLTAAERRCTDLEEAVRVEAARAKDAEAAIGAEVSKTRLADERARALEAELAGESGRANSAEAALAAESARLKDTQARLRAETERAEAIEERLHAETDRTQAAEERLRAEAGRAQTAEERLRAEADRAQTAEERLRSEADRAQSAEERVRSAEEMVTAAEAKNSASSRYLDELAAEFDAARLTAAAAQSELEARLAEAAARHDTLTAELDAARRQAEADRVAATTIASADSASADFQRRLEAADERIRELEFQLFGRDRGTPEADVDLVSLLEDPAPAGEQPIRRFSRYSFRSQIDVNVDEDPGVLVDLSVSGAQILSAAPLELHRDAIVSLVSDEIPVACRGKVVWSRADPQSRGKALRYRAGILFTDADPAVVEAFIIRYSAT